MWLNTHCSFYLVVYCCWFLASITLHYFHDFWSISTNQSHYSLFSYWTDQTITHHVRSWCDPHLHFCVNERWLISLTTGCWFRILGRWLNCHSCLLSLTGHLFLLFAPLGFIFVLYCQWYLISFFDCFLVFLIMHFFAVLIQFQPISLFTPCSDTWLIRPSHTTYAVGVILIYTFA